MVLSAVLAAGVWAHAHAASAKEKRIQAGQPGKPRVTPAPAALSRGAGGENGYYENVLEKVPFGSQRWWEVYGRQHGTPDG